MMVNTNKILCLLCCLSYPLVTESFLSSEPLMQRPQLSSSQLSNSMIEDLAYQAESFAGSLTTMTLHDEMGLATFPIIFCAGLLTAASPCVWGLLPLTTTYISQAAAASNGNVLLPSLSFSAGLASVYCSLGVAAAGVGGVFGSSSGIGLPLLSHTICLLMGFQLLEFIDLPLLNLQGPSSLIGPSGGGSKSQDEPILIDATGQVMAQKEESENRNALLQTFLLGASSGLVASPCSTPVLTSILSYCAQVHYDLSLTALLLLVYTLGYSTPLLIVAASGGKALNQLKQSNFGNIAPWVTPVTGGILLYYGTSGLLTTVLGEASLAGLPMLQ